MSAARTALASFVLAMVASPASAAEPDPGAARARTCVSIEEASARLACYDEALGRPVTAGAAAAAVPTAAPTGSTPEAVRAVDEFGLTEAAKRKRDPEKAKETMPESISAAVKRVSFRPTGEVVVTLDNDQVWEQAEAVTMSVRVKAGDTVTIRKSALGSYTLVTPGRAAIRVRRVR